MTDPILAAPTPAAVREELQNLIVGELLGPAGGPEEEVTEERLTERYILGMLAPRGETTAPEEEDALAVEGEPGTEEGQPEPDAPPIPTIFPSSFGLTFSVAGTASSLAVTPRWGRYQRERSRTETAEGEPPLVWRRYPTGGNLIAIELAEGMLGPVPADPDQPDVVIRGRARRSASDWLVTLFLVNGQAVPRTLKDEAWLFQAELMVESSDGAPVFLRRPTSASGLVSGPDTDEQQTLDMLYRGQVEFAVGHGVSVHADPDAGDPRRALRITAGAVPVYDLPRTDPPTVEDVPELAGVELDMARLAEASDEALPGLLTPLAEAYEAWIERQAARLTDPDARLEGYEHVAELALAGCRTAAERIRDGIQALTTSSDAGDAFRFANRAMWLQRVHSLAAQLLRRDPSRKLDEALAEVDVRQNRSWRPFQLAFVLLNLPSLIKPTHSERAGDGQGLVDLLWFPTGGGKTEAYLGLTAFAIAIRRMQGEVGGYDGRDGVVAIMRYTLRLLTIQQFQRATALVCACEFIRREDSDRWGTTPFRIGLWVGLRATPNTTDDADDWLKRARGAGAFMGGQSGTPAQLPFCPWCGTDINERKHLKVDPDLKRTLTYCGDPLGRCPFTERQSEREGLPVVVVDEEIYRLLPALLIGTVDKFAQLPWRGQVQTLFGRVTGRCERHGFRSPDLEDSDSHPKRGTLPAAKTVPAGPLRPPDLIIQDELHLIAGPLGSMVGLYEAAVDRLSTWEVNGKMVRPKVIASTATVRRAPQQAHALFWRQLEVFPPPGLDADDSFFALQRSTEEAPGRRYLGICAHGRQFKSTLIRVYVAQLAAAQALFDKYGSVADPWMTLVGYFNSLKDLGGMRRHVDDDVSNRLGRIERRGLARRQRPIVEELTSRKGSADIPRVLDQLSVAFRKERGKDDPIPIDVLLATNMISVGIDVPRLGAMVVAGQPKATAEYIQATSRIGRSEQGPGLVLTVYGWARPRDLSHYERFEHYHATFYRHVEALSVTPFAPRARDRGLTALLVSLVRQLESTWNAEPSAMEVDRHAHLVKEAVQAVLDRAAGVASLGGDELDEIRTGLQHRLDEWEEQQAVPGRKLAYRDKKDGVTVGLLRGPVIGGWSNWTCLTSLRDVEPGVNLVLDLGDLGDGGMPPFTFPPREETTPTAALVAAETPASAERSG
ncbi:MAG: DISARM system helicase DrmA [Actinomycetota bacterium]